MRFQERLSTRVAAAGLAVAPGVYEQLEQYYRLLTKWNQKINLTSLSLEPLAAAALDRLFVEPLAAAELVENDHLVWFDLGSGNGSPAIPLKLARPLASLTMVESTGKKCSFLREATRALGLANVKVLTMRAEELESIVAEGAVDLITIRGLKLDQVVKSATHLLKVSGRLFRFTSGESTPPSGFRLSLEKQLLHSRNTLAIFEKL